MARERTWECSCGGTVTSWGRDTDCPKCDQPFNAFGQELRRDWRGNPSSYDDEIGDMEGYEMQYANDDDIVSADYGKGWLYSIKGR